MSTHVLFNLLNKLRKSNKLQGLPSIYPVFAMILINSMIQESTDVRFYLSYYVKITLKLHRKLGFCHYLRNIVMDIIWA